MEPYHAYPSRIPFARRLGPADDAVVSAAILKRAVGDGDGRTGAAALNDGDAASQAAVAAAKSSVNIKA